MRPINPRFDVAHEAARESIGSLKLLGRDKAASNRLGRGR
jgi:hypothetical protein